MSKFVRLSIDVSDWLSHLCPTPEWDTQLIIFLDVTAIFALCPALFTKKV